MELKLRIQAALAERDEDEAERLLDELVRHRERLYQLTHTRSARHATDDRKLTEDPLTLLCCKTSMPGVDVTSRGR